MSGVYFEIFPTEGFDVRSATRYEEKSTNKKKKKKERTVRRNERYQRLPGEKRL